MAIGAFLILLTLTLIISVCGSTAFAIQTSTHSDADDTILDEGNVDTEDLGNQVLNASIPTAIAVGSSYLAIRKGIDYYSQKQAFLEEKRHRLSILDEKRKQYGKFLKYIGDAQDYESGSFRIKNYYELSRYLNSWYQKVYLDLPEELKISIKEFLVTLDTSRIAFDEKTPKEDAIETVPHYLENKLDKIKDEMRRDIIKDQRRIMEFSPPFENGTYRNKNENRNKKNSEV